MRQKQANEAYRTSAVMADLHKLLIHKLYTAQTGRLEKLNLWFDQQVERNFWYEETWSWSGRVANRGPNVLVIEVMRRVDRVQGLAKDVIEYIVYTCAAGQLLRRDVEIRAFDGRHEVACELCHETQDKGPLLYHHLA